MFLKKHKKPLLSFLLTVLLFPTFIFAYSDYLIVGGQNIGIELQATGVIIVGSYNVGDKTPAREAGLAIGDIIISVNNQNISKTTELQNIINNSNENSVSIKYMRNNQTYTTKLGITKDENGNKKTGLYVKDSITGIGTLTFIDPNTKIFGALGHEIIEKSSGKILEIKTGSIFKSSVSSINRSQNGSPGEKNAQFYPNNSLGTINKNTDKGVFGNYDLQETSNNLYKVAKPDDIKIGDADILTVLNGETIEKYQIRITKIINNGNKTKNIIFEITDDNLIKKTGGVVQGMSGSPIIQGEYIVGAITHVVIDNPKKGYGIFITNMLEEAEN